MTKGTYVEARVPWKVCFDPSSPHVRNFLAGLMNQTVLYGMPGIRRFGRAQTVAGRLGVPKAVLSSVPVWRKTERPDLDVFLGELATSWSSVTEDLPDLPPEAQPFHCLLLERRSAGTLFVFGSSPSPLLVAKFSREDPHVVAKEHGVLAQLAGLEVAPTPGPAIGNALLQEALPGAPMPLPKLSEPPAFSWTVEAEAASEALIRIAEVTGTSGAPDEVRDGAIERALGYGGFPAELRAELEEPLARWHGTQRSVLKHGDLSPQNCLFHNGRLAGIIDWATATRSGAPGFDVLNLGMSVFEHRLHLKKRSQTEAAELFDAYWRSAAFFRSLREATRRAVEAAGVQNDVRDTQLAFFTRRYGQRLVLGADQHATRQDAALLMLRCVAENY